MPGSNPSVEPARKGRKRRAASPPEDVDPVVANGFATVAGSHSVVSLAELSRRAGAYLPPEELARIREAYRFGDQAHLGQFRSSGAPYISHPIAVAEILASWKLDADTLMAALLHRLGEAIPAARDAAVRPDPGALAQPGPGHHEPGEVPRRGSASRVDPDGDRVARRGRVLAAGVSDPARRQPEGR